MGETKLFKEVKLSKEEIVFITSQLSGRIVYLEKLQKEELKNENIKSIVGLQKIITKIQNIQSNLLAYL